MEPSVQCHVRQQCAQPAGTVRQKACSAGHGRTHRSTCRRLGRCGGAVSCRVHPPCTRRGSLMSCRLGRGDDTGSTRQGLQEPKIPFRFGSGRLLLTSIGQSCSMTDADSSSVMEMDEITPSCSIHAMHHTVHDRRVHLLAMAIAF
jgi:hypothetical protein